MIIIKYNKSGSALPKLKFIFICIYTYKNLMIQNDT